MAAGFRAHSRYSVRYRTAATVSDLRRMKRECTLMHRVGGYAARNVSFEDADLAKLHLPSRNDRLNGVRRMFWKATDLPARPAVVPPLGKSKFDVTFHADGSLGVRDPHGSDFPQRVGGLPGRSAPLA